MINEIHLKNFKCHRDLMLKLSNLNVLTGINSTGKSTIIQALLVLKQSVDRTGDFRTLVLNDSIVQIGAGKDLININAGKEELVEISIKSTTDEPPKRHSLDVKYTYESDKTELNLVGTNDCRQGSPKNEVQHGEDNLYFKSIFEERLTVITADRIGPKRYYEKNEQYTDTLGHRGENTAAYLSGFDTRIEVAKELKHPNSDSTKIREQVAAWLSEISHHTKFQAVMDNSTGVSTIKFEEFLPTNIGFGVSYTLPIIVALLKAKKGDIIIVENPEAHLHPKGQRKLGELISRASANGVQIFIETHSDHILNGIRLSVKNKLILKEHIKLYYFYLEQDSSGNSQFSKCSPEILDDGRLSSWPEGFFDEWDKAVTELF